MRILRLLTLLYFIIVTNTGIVNAQDKERLKDLLKLNAKSDTFQLQTHSEKGNEVGSSYISGLKGGYDNLISPYLNFKPSRAWKFDLNAIPGLNNYQHIFWSNNPMLYGLPVNGNYFGLYGTAIHKVNDKLYIGTMTLINRTPDNMRMMKGYYNGGNINSSVFVGYKFSDKFSISAGFNLRRYDNPWKMGSSSFNEGYTP
jgi:hypothetical protein